MWLHILIFLSTFFALRSESVKNKMWEIQKKDMPRYLLSNCRSISYNKSKLHCQCKYLTRKCTSNDIEGCSENCQCLQQSPTKVFYIEKKHSSICVSGDEVYKQAGFSDAFLIYHKPDNVCATIIEDKSDVYHTRPCNTTDSNQVWFWTASGQIMNMIQLKCFEVVGSHRYRPLTIAMCNSTKQYQNFKCDDRKLWFGISANMDNGGTMITHAIRYYAIQKKLLARDINIQSGSSNIWTIYPTHNHSVCSRRVVQGKSSMNSRCTTLISFLPDCIVTDRNICAKRVLNQRHLSHCVLLLENILEKEHFAIESTNNGVYFTWLPDPFSMLVGTMINFSVECLTETNKYREFPFSLQVKPIKHTFLQNSYQFVPPTTTSNSTTISSLNIAQNCQNSLCTQQLDAPVIIDGNVSTCTILWDKSTIIINNQTLLVNTSSVVALFQLGKGVDNTAQLQWKSSDLMMLKEMVCNLTIYCYDNRMKNVSLSESSFIVFKTIYLKTTRDSMVSKTAGILPIILPIVAVMVIIVIVIIVLLLKYKRKRKMKCHESTDNLHGKSFDISHVNMAMKEEDNPYYEQCTAANHPAVTIARNKLYEHSTPYQNTRPDSDLYEKPTQSNVKASKKQFEATDPCTSPPHYKDPKIPRHKNKNATLPPIPGQEEDDGNLDYDEPLGVIPSSSHHDNYLPYEKPLPDTPPQNVYDYATRENALEQLALQNLSYRSSPENICEPSNDTPFYDVLDHAH